MATQISMLQMGLVSILKKKGESWWQVDLGDVYSIFNVRVFHAKDCCDIVVEEKDCYKENPSKYKGKTNTTETGLPCLSWGKKHPLAYANLNPKIFGVAPGENYCRAYTKYLRFYHWNALNKDIILEFNSIIRRNERPWCYTSDPEVLWEYCDIDICETDSVKNIALQKNTEMSSVSAGYISEHGVDGFRTQYLGEGSCFNTLEEENPWWRVDLSGIYLINMIRLFNRLDCCTECKLNPCENAGKCYLIHCEDKNCRRSLCVCEEGYGGINCELRTLNVAAGKQVLASSLHHKNWYPTNVVDGNKYQNVQYGATCVSTLKEMNPFIIINLDDEYNLTSVKVYKRNYSSCTSEEEYDIQLFVMVSEWINVGYTDGITGDVVIFYIHPYLATRSIKIMANEYRPVFLQLCEVEVYAIYREEFQSKITSTSPFRVAKSQSNPSIQMRFSFLDDYSDVVKSESSFINFVRLGLSLQSGYSLDSFQHLELERVPFRVALQLHAFEGNITLDEKFKTIDTLITFGLLEIENEYGHLCTVIAGSLQHHLIYAGNKGTIMTGVSNLFMFIFAVAAVGLL